MHEAFQVSGMQAASHAGWRCALALAKAALVNGAVVLFLSLAGLPSASAQAPAINCGQPASVNERMTCERIAGSSPSVAVNCGSPLSDAERRTCEGMVLGSASGLNSESSRDASIPTTVGNEVSTVPSPRDLSETVSEAIVQDQGPTPASSEITDEAGGNFLTGTSGPTAIASSGLGSSASQPSSDERDESGDWLWLWFLGGLILAVCAARMHHERKNQIGPWSRSAKVDWFKVLFGGRPDDFNA